MNILDIDCYMIVIKDNEASEYYADFCSESWECFGIKVKRFDAITPKNLSEVNNLKWSKFSNQQKYIRRNLKVLITETEKACFMSHYLLWKKSAETNKPILILEHDVWLEKPNKLWYDEKCGIIFFDRAAMGSYVINPWFAKRLIEYIKNIKKILSGPYALIYNFSNEKNYTSLVINDCHKLYDPASRQVMSRKYGNTIEHYCNLYPEHFPKEHFHQFKMID